MRLGRGRRGRRRRGAQWTGVTLSTEQLHWAQRRFGRAGLAARCDARLQDYRDLAAEGRRYDAVVSVEMFEAVGAPTGRLLPHPRALPAPGGRACVQTIVIRRRPLRPLTRARPTSSSSTSSRGMPPSTRVFRAGRRAPAVVRETGLRRRLRAHAARVEAELSERLPAVSGARLRRTLRPPVGLLSRLLRGGVRDRSDPTSCSSRWNMRTDPPSRSVGRWPAPLMLLCAGIGPDVACDATPPAQVVATGWRVQGEATMRFFGMPVYDATLTVPATFSPTPGRRSLALAALPPQPGAARPSPKRSLHEMRRAGAIDERGRALARVPESPSRRTRRRPHRRPLVAGHRHGQPAAQRRSLRARSPTRVRHALLRHLARAAYSEPVCVRALLALRDVSGVAASTSAPRRPLPGASRRWRRPDRAACAARELRRTRRAAGLRRAAAVRSSRSTRRANGACRWRDWGCCCWACASPMRCSIRGSAAGPDRAFAGTRGARGVSAGGATALMVAGVAGLFLVPVPPFAGSAGYGSGPQCCSR